LIKEAEVDESLAVSLRSSLLIAEASFLYLLLNVIT
jgi:hypothetical protein